MEVRRNIKLKVEYDGTNYAGWQRQKNAVTIQQTLEDAVLKATGEQAEVIGCSRTDTGVHAEGFIANFHTHSRIPDNKFKDAMNSFLPKDIVVLESEEVDEAFHARYFSSGKTYIYTILNRPQPSALYRNYVYHYRQALDIEKMREAAQHFIGRHDFASFRNLGSSVKTTTRTITQLTIEKAGDFITIKVSADGFLYNMVRIIVGTLIDVGIGKLKSEHITQILLSKDRTKAGKSAPAQGLCLEAVFYDTVPHTDK